MKRFRNLSISRKLILAFLLASILPLLIAVALVLAYELAGQRARIISNLITQAEMIAVSTRATLEFEDPKSAQETLATLATRPEIHSACLYTSDGAVFATYIRGDDGSFKFPSVGEAGHRILGDNLDLFYPIGSGADLVGHVFLRVDMRILRARLPNYFAIVGSVVIGLMAVCYWMSRALEKFISGPILSLAETSQIVQETRNYSIRAQKHGDDEIGQLTESFNQMVGGIEEGTNRLLLSNERLQAEVIERERAEGEIKLHSLELEATNKELEAFSYTISHDLRAPLRAVDGYIRMLQEDYAKQLDAEANRLIAVVSSEARRMGQLIDDLLAFVRLGRQQMHTTVIDMTSLARETFGSVAGANSTLPHRFELQPLPPAQGNLAMLRQVFLNLISNAVKFSRHRQTPVIEVGGWSHEGLMTFFVKDNGVGFDDKYIHKLFNVFQRLHTEEEFEGTGVGLAIVQRVIHRHGGKVWAEGKPNQGATFYFTLPK